MDHRIKKGLTALLAACMLLSLAACGKDQDEDAEKLSGTVFVPEFIDMDLGKNGEVRGGCTDGTYIYLLTAKYPDWEAGEEGLSGGASPPPQAARESSRHPASRAA